MNTSLRRKTWDEKNKSREIKYECAIKNIDLGEILGKEPKPVTVQEQDIKLVNVK